ncbi:HIT zinc finger [Metarhizium brunneum]
MADPLLTSLCSICHVSTPKYKCPRCNIQTCSLPCAKKHKAWSECSGRRDPTTYVPRSKLRTAAGVDHDYNFLHAIEVSVERSEKMLVEEKGLVQQAELRPLTIQQVRWKMGRDGRKRKVLVTRVLREAKGRTFEKGLAQRLKRLNVQIVCAPLGMARQRENSTKLNRRTGRINWQVEWLVVGGEKETARSLSKVMDDVPLFQAYPAMLEEKVRAETGSRKQERHMRAWEVQSWADSRWNLGLDCMQDPVDGKWTLFSGGRVEDWPAEKEKAQRQQFQFFLAGPLARSDMPAQVTALEAGDCLRDILANTRVLEFPTIYVLKRGDILPPRFVLGPKDSVPPQIQRTKRKDGPSNTQFQASSKRRKQGRMDREEGEVGTDEDREDGLDEGTESKGVSLEAAEVIAEQSLGEEEDDDDDTSSSGSDSESG